MPLEEQRFAVNKAEHLIFLIYKEFLQINKKHY